MKRWLVKLVVFLLLGAIANVAVAWGCSNLWRPNWQSSHWSNDGDWIYRCAIATYRIGPLLCELSTGWPTKSMLVSWLGGWQEGDSMVFRVPGMPVGAAKTSIVEPLHPIWPGFAINTMFYAAVLWMMFAFPFVVRRYFRGRRIKRGLCPACAYPIGTSSVCTECGKPVKQKAETQKAEMA